jgi:single-stranded-DNA-specific exonuclease
MGQIRWVIAPVDERRTTLVEQLNISPIMGQMLLNRGIANINKARDYLAPALGQLLSPLTLPNMAKAAERIAFAIRSKQRIWIWGDYDVDGISGTATMYHALKHFGANVQTYLPDRVGEGYGLSDQGIKTIADKGCDLLITVDCGITGNKQVALANELDYDVIITDHHEWQGALPDAYAIVHPRIAQPTPPVDYELPLGSNPTPPPYANPHICGAGVAFKTMWAVGMALNDGVKVSDSFRPVLQELMAFTALGTIADVVPLIGENRVIAHYGLTRLPKSEFIGIRALISSARFEGQDIDGYKVGFSLAPRLNAAGRMGHANEALDLLLSEDADKAEQIATELEKKNRERQETEKAIAVEAIAQAEMFPYRSVQVVTGKDWHPGVVGIVASRLVEHFHVPAIVLVDSGEELHGSARSIEGFNLAEMLGACKEYLLRYGGHAMAAGLKMEAWRLEPFLMAANFYGDDHITQEMRIPKMEIDAVVSLGEITLALAQDINRMGPFGSHNRRPLLAIKDALIVESKQIGKDKKHLMMVVAQGSDRMKALAFGQGDLAHKIPMDTRVDLCVEPTINEFRGQTNVELLVRDILPLS